MTKYPKTSVDLTKNATGTITFYVTVPAFRQTEDSRYFHFKFTLTEVAESLQTDIHHHIVSPTTLFGRYVMSSDLLLCDCCGGTDISGIECQTKVIQSNDTIESVDWQLTTFCPTCAKKLETVLYTLLLEEYPEYFISDQI